MELKIIEKFTVQDKYSFKNESMAHEYLNLLNKFEKDYLSKIRIEDLNRDKNIIKETLYNYYKYLDKGIKIDKINFFDFGTKEILSINEALKHNLDIKWINNPKYNDLQMLEIIRGLKNNLNVSIYAKNYFSWEQMSEIRWGLEQGLNVNIYAKTEFNSQQMNEIKLGLYKNLDISFYAKPEFNQNKMHTIRTDLEKKNKEIKLMQLNWNELADDMKKMEKAESTKLDVNKTIVIRLDMRSGGSFVRGLNKPFDDSFSEAMEHTAKELAKQVQGAQLVYFGSDEITILLFKNKVKKEFTPFFEGKLQKTVSLTAAIATAEFNNAWYEIINKTKDTDYKEILQRKLFNARFDSRAFNIEGGINEALSSVWWRMKDVSRNSVQMLGRKYFSQKQVQNLKTYEVENKLDSIGHNWENEVKTVNKYGNLFIREEYLGKGYNPKTKEEVEVIRHDWFGTTEDELKEFLNIKNLEDFKTTKIFKRLKYKK